MNAEPFLGDIKVLRERARHHMENGAVTPGYRANQTTVVKLLNEALATEIICVLRYRRHHFMASGLNARSVAEEFLAHSLSHQIARRIVQIGGEPNFSPEGLATRSHSEYVEGTTLIGMIEEDLIAERVAIDSYRGMITYLADTDPTTRRMLEEILATEEEHAEDLAGFVKELGA